MLMKNWFRLLLSTGMMGLTFLFMSTIGTAQDKRPMTEGKAKEVIQSGTSIRACGDPVFVFQTVQIGAKVKQKDGDKQIEVYPAHARFSVRCRYGNEQMRAEVDLTTAYYMDPFGAWKASGPDYEGDQTWDNTQSDVRCRVQNLAHLTVDSTGKVTGSTPAKDQGYIGCTVQPKAAD
jgi:hypothetical protein